MFHILLFSSSLWSTQDASHVFKVTQKHDCGFLRKKQCCNSYKLTEHLNLTPLQGHKLGHHFLSFVTPTTTLLTCIKHGEKRYDQNYGSFLCNLEHINHSKKKKKLKSICQMRIATKRIRNLQVCHFHLRSWGSQQQQFDSWHVALAAKNKMVNPHKRWHECPWKCKNHLTFWKWESLKHTAEVEGTDVGVVPLGPRAGTGIHMLLICKQRSDDWWVYEPVKV